MKDVKVKYTYVSYCKLCFVKYVYSPQLLLMLLFLVLIFTIKIVLE